MRLTGFPSINQSVCSRWWFPWQSRSGFTTEPCQALGQRPAFASRMVAQRPRKHPAGLWVLDFGNGKCSKTGARGSFSSLLTGEILEAPQKRDAANFHQAWLLRRASISQGS